MLKTVSSITNAIGALNYKGTWNASTNSPALASGVGTKGDYYVVSVAGSTNLDGETLWGVGDWAVFNGSVWQKVEGGNTINATTVSASTSVTTPVIQATSSAGGTLKNNGGTAQLQWGSGGGSNLSLEVATNINPANAAVAISPTGTGTVTINPATASTMNNVAIGGITPLAITGTTITATGVATFSAGTVSAPSITTTGDTNTGIFFPAADTIGFVEGGVEAMRIDSSGNVGIISDGVIAANTKLQVGGNINLYNSSVDVATQASPARIGSYNQDNASVNYQSGTDGGGAYSAIKIISNWNGSTNTGGGLFFYSGATLRTTIFPSGGVSIGNSTDPGDTNLSVTGTGKFGTTVGVGAATPSTSGAGITFPATQSASTDANTLDDYEEGTYEATVTCDSGTITLGTFTTLTYTKIGRLVTVNGYLYVTAVSAPSGFMKLNILPFPINSSTSGFYIGGYLYTSGLNATAATAMQFNGSPGDSFVLVEHFAAGVAGNAAADFKATSSIIISLSYFV